MSEWEKLVSEGQLKIADTSSKKMPVELYLLFEKQTESEGAYCTQKMNVCIIFINSLQIHSAEVISWSWKNNLCHSTRPPHTLPSHSRYLKR